MKKQDRPPMEPTWLTSPTLNARESSKDTSIPCIVLRKLEVLDGTSGEHNSDFELVTGTHYKNDIDLMNYLLPNNAQDSIEKSRITSPIAFRYLGVSDEKSQDLCNEVIQPYAPKLGMVFQTIHGLTEGCRNSIHKSDQLMMRALQLIEPHAHELVFQRTIQNIYFERDLEQTQVLMSGIEQIR